MISFNIPGRKPLEITDVIFDFNGTIARDGKLSDGVKKAIEQFSEQIRFHIITADTFGSVKKQLSGLDAVLKIISSDNQDQKKLDYLSKTGPVCSICVGNGANDALMLKACAIGIAVLGEEGLAASALTASDLVVGNILDVFGFLRTPERLIATLRL